MQSAPPTSRGPRSTACAGMGGAGPITQVDHLVGGLLDPQSLGQVAGSNSPALATAWVSSKRMPTTAACSAPG